MTVFLRLTCNYLQLRMRLGMPPNAFHAVRDIFDIRTRPATQKRYRFLAGYEPSYRHEHMLVNSSWLLHGVITWHRQCLFSVLWLFGGEMRRHKSTCPRPWGFKRESKTIYQASARYPLYISVKPRSYPPYRRSEPSTFFVDHASYQVMSNASVGAVYILQSKYRSQRLLPQFPL